VVELLHNATLIHDGLRRREHPSRGRPTVAAAEGPRGRSPVGDYYFAKATRLIAEIGNRGVTSTIAKKLSRRSAPPRSTTLRSVELFPLTRSYLRDRALKTGGAVRGGVRVRRPAADASPEIVEALPPDGDLLASRSRWRTTWSTSAQARQAVGLEFANVCCPYLLSMPRRTARSDLMIRRLLAGLARRGPRSAGSQDLVTSSDALQRVRGEAQALVEAAGCMSSRPSSWTA